MPSQTSKPATNARIMALLEELRTELARASKRQEEIARDLARLLRRQ